MAVGGCTKLTWTVIVGCLVFDPSTEGNKVRACTGQEARLSCSSGWYIVDTSAVGGFGPSGTPCTATASCMTNSVRGSLTEVNGNLAAFASNKCNNKQTCNFLIDSNWQSASSYCDSHVYSIIYVDVEYNCHLLTIAPSTVTPVLTTTIEPQNKKSTNTDDVTNTLQNDTSTDTIAEPHVANTAIMTSAKQSETIADVTDGQRATGTLTWWWYAVGGGGGLIAIITIIAIAICVSRRSSQKRADSETEPPDDVTPYVNTRIVTTITTPHIVYDVTRIPDQTGESVINCYATATIAAAVDAAAIDAAAMDSAATKQDDALTSEEAEVGDSMYAVVNKENKSKIISEETDLFDNTDYVPL